ncbi:MAG: beta-galactosidase trimerization domain-containing protein [Phycisphaerae bacterium]
MQSDTSQTADAWANRHDSPLQRKFRRIHPMPVGVVFIEWPGMDEEDIRRHFRQMKELGFTCLKGLMTCPGTDPKKVQHMALDEGIIPWWFGEGGWEFSDELLQELGIDPDTPIEEIRSNEKFLAHQEQVMRRRIESPPVRGQAANSPGEGAVPFSFDMELADGAIDAFVDWLEDTYSTVEKLKEAWNYHHAGIGGRHMDWDSWDDVRQNIRRAPHKEYRHYRDILRFKADVFLDRIRSRAERFRYSDASAPFRAGGEMGLFLPFAARATDMGGIAELMGEYGSFYPSMHLSWHFEETNFEVPRSVYLQASLAADWFKGGWSATWESTGGPQQLSGGKGWTPEAAAETPGFTVDENVMTQLMLSYLAAGFRGFGFWCYSARTAGWEAGEFALLDRNNNVTERARQVGRVGQAARRLRDELWESRKDPMVGVFTDFDSDAMWAAASVVGREKYKNMPVEARVGATRALQERNVPFEHVSGRDLRAGLADRYKIIYLPAILSLDQGLLEILHEYVCGGGRLVMDLPTGWLDEYGRLLNTDKGTLFERTFGCVLRDFQYSRNVPRKLRGHRLGGFVADLEPTKATVVETYDDGKPAITENKLGEGTAVVLGYDGSLAAFKSPEGDEADWLVADALGTMEPPFSCEGALAYRQVGPAADHYFLINPGEERSVLLDTKGLRYRGAEDAVTRERVSLEKPIELPRCGGRWLRLEK